MIVYLSHHFIKSLDNIPLTSSRVISTLDQLLNLVLENRLLSIKVIDLYGNGITYEQYHKFTSEIAYLYPHLLCHFRDANPTDWEVEYIEKNIINGEIVPFSRLHITSILL